MKKILLTILISLSLVLPARAGIEIGSNSLASTNNADTATDATISFLIYPYTVSGTTHRYIVQFTGTLFTPLIIEVYNSTIRITNGSSSFLCSNNDGVWTVPVSANTWQYVEIQKQWGTDSGTPGVKINGVKQAVTNVGGTPNCTIAIGNGITYVGGSSTNTNLFDGIIDEFSWGASLLSDTIATNLTSSGKKHEPLGAYGITLRNYWAIDDLGDDVSVSGTQTFKDYATSSNNLTVTSGKGKGERYLSYP